MSNKNKKNILAVIQARMGSSRLPNKVMKEVDDKPLIGYLIERLLLTKQIDKIILATSKNQENDPLVEYVQSLGIAVFRGDENNVLSRFHQVANFYEATDILRITGDSPLLDPFICDNLIDHYLENKVDYAYLSERFCEGVDCEIFSANALRKLANFSLKPSHYEHVTLYMYQNPDLFNISFLENETNDAKYRFTVDNEEDFFVVSKLINDMNKTAGFYSTKLIKTFLDKHPDIYKVNSHIIRNEGLAISLKSEE